MASAWGESWGAAWGDSWGAISPVEPGVESVVCFPGMIESKNIDGTIAEISFNGTIESDC